MRAPGYYPKGHNRLNRKYTELGRLSCPGPMRGASGSHQTCRTISISAVVTDRKLFRITQGSRYVVSGMIQRLISGQK